VKLGDDVLYVADVLLFGPMELLELVKHGQREMALCRLETGEFELFGVHEIGTVEAVAKAAAAGLGDAAEAA
jgi:hypothetical protein